MSDIRAISQTLRRLRSEQIRYLVATVMQASGSSYRRPGARLLIGEDGSVTGGISAGCLEAALIRTAWWRTRDHDAVLVKYDSTSDDDELGWGSGFGCNGVVEVLVERQHPASEAALDFIAGTLVDEQIGCLMTVFRSSAAGIPVGSRVSLTADGHVAFHADAQWGRFIGDGELAVARQAMKTGHGRTLILPSNDMGQIDVLVEPVVPPPRLFLCGEGPDAVSLARFACDLGWSVVIWASGPRWFSRERSHGLGELSTGSVDDLCRAVDSCARPAAIILSHHYDRDRDLLEGLLRSKTSYIGILGPRARSLRLLAEVGQDLASDVTRRIHAPIGLDIGAETPQEIGLSVMAEIQAVLSGSTAKPLSQCRGRNQRTRLVSLDSAAGAE